MREDHARELVARSLRLSLESVPFDGSIETIPGWDSLSHFEVISAIENQTQRRLTADEVVGLRSVKDVAVLLGP